MGIRLSHTAKEKYLNCPLSYYMHYQLNLREEIVGSALPFGIAIDEAQGTMLEGKQLKDVLEQFEKLWESPKINGQILKGSQTNKIRFSKADAKEGLGDTPWENMLEKGKLLLEAYYEEIMPQIKDVLAVQQVVNVKNDSGDSIFGLADMIVKWKDGRNVLVDNKTASKKYKEDAITNLDGPEQDKAKQLALYYENLKDRFSLDAVGLIVLEKEIRKKDPKTRIQVLINETTEEIIEKTFDEFEEVLYGIRMGQFPSNNPKCNKFYGDCVCSKYYPSGGTDLTGLVNVKKDRK
jgi:CRISPR/Cas system-associated exonuclease Cas4 (RecB family)